MVLGQTFDVMVERVQAGAGEYTGLPPARAEPLAPLPRLGDPFRRPDQDGTHRRTKPLGQTDGHGVEEPSVGLEGIARRDVCVPEPCTVQVQAHSGAVDQASQCPQVGQRLHGSTGEVVSVLDGDRRRRHEVRARGRRHQRRDRVEVHMPLRVRPGPRRHTLPRRVRPELGPHHVRLGLAEQFLPGCDVRADPEQVGQRAGDREQPGLMAQQARDPFFQRGRRRVLAVHVVTGFSRSHRREHRRRGPGHRVAAQVDRHGIDPR